MTNKLLLNLGGGGGGERKKKKKKKFGETACFSPNPAEKN